jgi:D-alanine-D-alanine ligase
LNPTEGDWPPVHRSFRVAVLMGGISNERSVSLASGTQVARALRSRGHQVVAVDTARGVLTHDDEARILETGVAPPPAREQTGQAESDLMESGDLASLLTDPALRDVEVFFPALHGGRGEDGTLQALLELQRLVYTGSDRLGCTLSMDKEVSKRLFRDAGIPTPSWLTGAASLDQVEEELGLPVIVKPPSGGSTLGLTLAHDRSELEAAVVEARQFEDRILYESYVRGRELTVGVVGTRPLPVGEIIPAHELFDYECKYQPGLAQEIFPASVPAQLASGLQELALQVHRTLFLRDYSRVDFLVDEEGGIWCLEANALPGMTANSLLPQAGEAGGLPFPRLCEEIVRLALERTGRL